MSEEQPTMIRSAVVFDNTRDQSHHQGNKGRHRLKDCQIRSNHTPLAAKQERNDCSKPKDEPPCPTSGHDERKRSISNHSTTVLVIDPKQSTPRDRPVDVSSQSRRSFNVRRENRPRNRPACGQHMAPRPRIISLANDQNVPRLYLECPPTPPLSPSGPDWSSSTWELSSDHSSAANCKQEMKTRGGGKDFWGELPDASTKVPDGPDAPNQQEFTIPSSPKSMQLTCSITDAAMRIGKDESGAQTTKIGVQSSMLSNISSSGVFSEHEDNEGMPTCGIKTEMSSMGQQDIQKWLWKLPASSAWDQPNSRYTVEHWIVPHQWAEYPPLGDNKSSLSEFWSSLHKSLRMLKSEDPPNNHPWWTTYINDTPAPFLRRPHQPNSILDPNDSTYKQGKAHQGTAEYKIRNHVSTKAHTNDACHHPLRHGKKSARFSVIESNNQNRNPYRKPPVNPAYQGNANMYIRLATDGDAQQLCDIYNHFIEHTWYVPEKRPLSLEQMQDRLRDVNAAKWPWLVAVEKSGTYRATRSARRRGGPTLNSAFLQLSMTSEKIMGFAYASDHFSEESTDHVTAQVHFWVLPECQHSKVGTTLIDRLFFCLLDDYEPFTDAEYRVLHEPFNTAGGCTRKVHSILASMQYAPKGEDEARANIVQGFLLKYGFEQYGEQKEVGWRKNRYLNRKLFQRICVENADGAHSDFGAQWDTESITKGEARYFSPENDTFEKREERRLDKLDRERGDKCRPLPLVWKPVARR